MKFEDVHGCKFKYDRKSGINTPIPSTTVRSHIIPLLLSDSKVMRERIMRPKVELDGSMALSPCRKRKSATSCSSGLAHRDKQDTTA